MIVPSIDIQDGRTVQLVGGERLAVDAGAPEPLAERFGVVGPIAVIDLDAARGEGDNAEVLRSVVARHRCRVGGGVRTVEAARAWLDAGAEQVILGTAARPELLRQLPPSRVIAAVDARDGEVVVDGWRTRTGRDLTDTVRDLAPYVGGFLVTFVEAEGRMGGLPTDRLTELLQAAGDATLTVAGGVRDAEEIARLDALGIDAQVGMALYTGRMGLGDAFAACGRSDRADGRIPTVVVDPHQRALGLVYSSRDTLAELVDRRVGVYDSRRRGRWEKGLTSGATQQVRSVAWDCDRDAVRVTVEQAGAGFCHRATPTCFDGPDDRGLVGLARRLQQRVEDAPAGSYTRRLLDDPGLLRAKLLEEAAELAEADTAPDITHETADLLFFALTAMVRGGVSLASVEDLLDRRALRLTRRPGDAKETP